LIIVLLDNDERIIMRRSVTLLSWPPQDFGGDVLISPLISHLPPFSAI
jgi:hypothetical protein